jgi:CRP-like cAMP-binding protein
MSLEDDIAFFEQVPTFAKLSREALQVLAIGAETRHLHSGAVLFYTGELADGGYIVQEGSLVLERGAFSDERKYDDREYVVGPGALIGELALITDTVCQATAIAKEPTTVIRISRTLFRKMLEGYPDAAAQLRAVLAARMQDFTNELSSVRRKLDATEEK